MREVKFSTFTLNDDILIMIGKSIYIFDGFGNPIQL